MMQQLDTLTQMVQSLSTRSKLLKTLVEQVRDNVSVKKVKIADLQTTTHSLWDPLGTGSTP
jgi:translation initiation factor 2 alpha subunit (eIF-2alpha)